MQHVSYCRICPSICGIVVEVEKGRAVRVSGDREHPLTQGYTCAKGRALGRLHHDPSRFLESQRRGDDGALHPVPAGTAIAEIGVRLRSIVETHGPDAVAMFIGTQAYTSTLTHAFAQAWFRSAGSNKLFTTTTIDQSAKIVAGARMGYWQGGGQRFEDSDVWLLAGTNPLVSMQGGGLTGFPVFNGLQRLREAKARGLRLIVVDPRRTETAAQAGIHLRPIPGTDVVLYAGLLRVLLAERLEDAEFCARHVDGLDALRQAVAVARPDAVEAKTGVPAAEMVRAARVFGSARKGMARSGTGPNMGPWSNLAEHLLTAMNVVCGRYARAGDVFTDSGAIGGPARPRAQVGAPYRPWEHGFRSRTGFGMINGQLPSGILADEIVSPGGDRVRALVVVGGNPVVALPDTVKAVRALSSLELLVTVDPFPSETARLAHYVIAPAMGLERPDHTRPYERYYSAAFAQYTPAVLPRPAGVIEDWEFFVRLAEAMDLPLQLGRRALMPGDPLPTADEVLAWFAERGTVPYDRVRSHPHGLIASDVAPQRVLPGGDGPECFDLLPDDVAGELRAALAAPRDPRPFRLLTRRAKETMNSVGRRGPRVAPAAYNPCFLHAADIERLGAVPGDLVVLESDHGAIRAVLAADRTLMPGVAAMTHGYGGLPGEDDDPRRFGTNPNRLVSNERDVEAINAMPRFSAIPVSIDLLRPGLLSADRAPLSAP